MGSLPSGSELRYVLLPNDQPEPGYSLKLFPANRIQGTEILSPPPYDRLLERFRECQLRFAECETWIHAHPLGCHYDGDYLNLGSMRFLVDSQEGKWIFHIVAPKEYSELEWFLEFKKSADEAGLHLPVEIKDVLGWCIPSTPFAWWFVTILAYGYSQPSILKTGVGTCFPNLFERSVRTIESLHCLGPQSTIADRDVWSIPLTRPSIAKIISGKANLNRTQQAKVLSGLTLKKFSDGKLYQVRLNDLSDELKVRLSRP